MKKICALLVTLVALGTSTSMVFGAASAPESTPAANASGEAQKAAFKALDALFARIDVLLDKISDPTYQTQAKGSVDALKARREALRQDFVQATYEDLKFDATIDHHRMAVWLEEPSVKRLPGSGETRASPSTAEKKGEPKK